MYMYMFPICCWANLGEGVPRRFAHNRQGPHQHHQAPADVLLGGARYIQRLRTGDYIWAKGLIGRAPGINRDI